MALETLKGITEIEGEKVLSERAKNPDGSIDWQKTDELRKECPIFIDHDVNMISFRIQNGPIKEAGKNGCQVDQIIGAAKLILEGFQKNFGCRENALAITHLDEALHWLEHRRKAREKRGVEGTSQK